MLIYRLRNDDDDYFDGIKIMPKLTISAHEVEPDDEIDGKKVYCVSPPVIENGDVLIYFIGYPYPFAVSGSAKVLVTRNTNIIDGEFK